LGQFGNQAGAPALSHFGGKFPRGFLRDDAAFAAHKCSAGFVEGRQKRQAAAFPFFPQPKRFPYGFFSLRNRPLSTARRASAFGRT
jgi:hypothetical protein